MGGLRDGHLDRRERAGIPEIGINVTALDDTSGTDLVPVHASFRDNAVHWLPPVPEIERRAAG
ncbi:hypothetical protein [Streptomyces sp. NPDC006739]|uniref:hypothetical protein n=1 Tax=Streptomyces sp. NPDC006739 TaxID=3364763 RepID=UPI0036A3F6AB